MFITGNSIWHTNDTQLFNISLHRFASQNNIAIPHTSNCRLYCFNLRTKLVIWINSNCNISSRFFFNQFFELLSHLMPGMSLCIDMTEYQIDFLHLCWCRFTSRLFFLFCFCRHRSSIFFLRFCCCRSGTSTSRQHAGRHYSCSTKSHKFFHLSHSCNSSSF